LEFSGSFIRDARVEGVRHRFQSKSKKRREGYFAGWGRGGLLEAASSIKMIDADW
jgi:hypothetical protein